MQWKPKNVSNSREIEKLIQSLEEDISFGKAEVKGKLKRLREKLPLMANLPSLPFVVYLNTTVQDYNRQCSQKPLVEGKKKRN